MVPSPDPDPPDDDPPDPVDDSSAEYDDWARTHEPGSPRDPEAVGGSADEAAPGDDPADEDEFAIELAKGVLRRGLAVLTAFFLGGLGFVVGLPLVFVAGVFLFVLGLDSSAGRLVASLIALQGIAFPTVALGYLGFRRGLAVLLEREYDAEFVRLKVPSLVDVGATVLGFIGVVGLVFASLLLVTFLNAPTAERTDSEVLFQNPELLLLLIPASFLLIGPGEELLFRGIIQDRLREAFSPVVAILLASAAFAPAHVFALSGGLQALAITIGILFVPSLVFGATYELTGNLLVPITIHGAYNALIFGTMYVSITLGSDPATLVAAVPQ